MSQQQIYIPPTGKTWRYSLDGATGKVTEINPASAGLRTVAPFSADGTVLAIGQESQVTIGGHLQMSAETNGVSVPGGSSEAGWAGSVRMGDEEPVGANAWWKDPKKVREHLARLDEAKATKSWRVRPYEVAQHGPEHLALTPEAKAAVERMKKFKPTVKAVAPFLHAKDLNHHVADMAAVVAGTKPGAEVSHPANENLDEGTRRTLASLVSEAMRQGHHVHSVGTPGVPSRLYVGRDAEAGRRVAQDNADFQNDPESRLANDPEFHTRRGRFFGYPEEAIQRFLHSHRTGKPICGPGSDYEEPTQLGLRFDLAAPPTKQTRESAFGYIDMPKGAIEATFAQCASCVQFTGSRCLSFRPTDKVVPAGACNLYVYGLPVSEAEVTDDCFGDASPKDAGYVERPVRCGNCSSYHQKDDHGECELYEQLNKALPDYWALKEHVKPSSCCNAQTGTKEGRLSLGVTRMAATGHPLGYEHHDKTATGEPAEQYSHQGFDQYHQGAAAMAMENAIKSGKYGVQSATPRSFEHDRSHAIHYVAGPTGHVTMHVHPIEDDTGWYEGLRQGERANFGNDHRPHPKSGIRRGMAAAHDRAVAAGNTLGRFQIHPNTPAMGLLKAAHEAVSSASRKNMQGEGYYHADHSPTLILADYLDEGPTREHSAVAQKIRDYVSEKEAPPELRQILYWLATENAPKGESAQMSLAELPGVRMAQEQAEEPDGEQAAPGVYLFRHGKTKLNSDGESPDLIRGWLDVPLDEGGKEQAEALGPLGTKLRIETVYSSDLQRAKATADAIAEDAGLSVKPTKDLRPWNLGDFQGKSAAEVAPKLVHYSTETPGQNVPQGESFEDWCNRYLPFLQKAMDEHEKDGENIALVTHYRNCKLAEAWVAAGLGESIDGDTFFADDLKTGAVLRLFRQDGGWKIERVRVPGVRMSVTIRFAEPEPAPPWHEVREHEGGHGVFREGEEKPEGVFKDPKHAKQYQFELNKGRKTKDEPWPPRIQAPMAKAKAPPKPAPKVPEKLAEGPSAQNAQSGEAPKAEEKPAQAPAETPQVQPVATNATHLQRQVHDNEKKVEKGIEQVEAKHPKVAAVVEQVRKDPKNAGQKLRKEIEEIKPTLVGELTGHPQPVEPAAPAEGAGGQPPAEAPPVAQGEEAQPKGRSFKLPGEKDRPRHERQGTLPGTANSPQEAAKVAGMGGPAPEAAPERPEDVLGPGPDYNPDQMEIPFPEPEPTPQGRPSPPNGEPQGEQVQYREAPVGTYQVDQRVQFENPHTKTPATGHIAALDKAKGAATVETDDGGTVTLPLNHPVRLESHERAPQMLSTFQHGHTVEFQHPGKPGEVIRGTVNKQKRQAGEPMPPPGHVRVDVPGRGTMMVPEKTWAQHSTPHPEGKAQAPVGPGVQQELPGVGRGRAVPYPKPLEPGKLPFPADRPTGPPQPMELPKASRDKSINDLAGKEKRTPEEEAQLIDLLGAPRGATYEAVGQPDPQGPAYHVVRYEGRQYFMDAAEPGKMTAVEPGPDDQHKVHQHDRGKITPPTPGPPPGAKPPTPALPGKPPEESPAGPKGTGKLESERLDRAKERATQITQEAAAKADPKTKEEAEAARKKGEDWLTKTAGQKGWGHSLKVIGLVLGGLYALHALRRHPSGLPIMLALAGLYFWAQHKAKEKGEGDKEAGSDEDAQKDAEEMVGGMTPEGDPKVKLKWKEPGDSGYGNDERGLPAYGTTAGGLAKAPRGQEPSGTSEAHGQPKDFPGQGPPPMAPGTPPPNPPGGEPPAGPPPQPAPKPPAAPPAPPSVAAGAEDGPQPGWMKHEQDRSLAAAKRGGYDTKIADLAAQHKTAKEIAKELGVDEIEVLQVRNALGIPSMAEAPGFMGGPAQKINPKFVEWRDKYLQGKRAAAPTTAPQAPPSPPEAAKRAEAPMTPQQAQATPQAGAQTIKDALGGFGTGMVDSLYKGLYDALAKGSDRHAGVKDPVLAKAKPFFDKGLVKSPEDLRKLVGANYDPQKAGLQQPAPKPDINTLEQAQTAPEKERERQKTAGTPRPTNVGGAASAQPAARPLEEMSPKEIADEYYRLHNSPESSRTPEQKRRLRDISVVASVDLNDHPTRAAEKARSKALAAGANADEAARVGEAARVYSEKNSVNRMQNYAKKSYYVSPRDMRDTEGLLKGEAPKELSNRLLELASAWEVGVDRYKDTPQDVVAKIRQAYGQSGAAARQKMSLEDLVQLSWQSFLEAGGTDSPQNFTRLQGDATRLSLHHDPQPAARLITQHVRSITSY